MKRVLLAAAILGLLPFSLAAAAPVRIVAVVNNDVITSYQLDTALRENLASAEGANAPDAAQQRQVLEQLIEEQLLFQQADAIGLKIGDDEIDAAVNDVQKQNRIDRKQLEEALQRQGIPFEQYRETLRRQILRYKLLGREIQSRTEVSSREVRDYYQEHHAEFRQPPALQLSRISFPFPADADAAARDALRAAATAARERLVKGADFNQLLAELQQQKVANGGDMGMVAEEEMSPDFVSAVRDLPPGAVSAVVENPAGLHLLRVDGRVSGEELPFEAVQEQIVTTLAEKKKATAMQDWMTELKSKARIEIRD